MPGLFCGRTSHSYPVFEQRSPGFELLVGDYSSLPRGYLPEDYLKDANGFAVKTVCAEFMSADAAKEALWAENLSGKEGHPHGIGGATLDNGENYLIKKLLNGGLGILPIENQARV